MAHAKNCAHHAATGDVLVNLDADNFTGAGFARYLIEEFRNGFQMAIPRPNRTGETSRIASDRIVRPIGRSSGGAKGLQHKGAHPEIVGTDRSFRRLAIDGVKFSGNAQRRRRSFLLFHGTFLLNFEIELMVNTLRPPSKAPEYRRNRSHCDFVRNISIPAPELKEALKEAWHAAEPLDSVPWPTIDQLVKQRHATQEWTFKF